jgi:hypothetical protein
MEQCSWPGCGIPVTYSGRGRPPKYCPDHAKASKQRSDKRRPDSGHARKRYPQCCLDAQAARVRTYGGGAHVKPASVRTCAQHQQWRAFYGRGRERFIAQQSEARAERNNPQLVEVKTSKAFRLTMGNPDDYIVTTRTVVRTSAGAKVGYDAELEAMARQWLASAPNGRERDDDVAIIETCPPDIGYWQEKCANGRRWHKSDAFRYPPEMNRGAGWCAKLIPLSGGIYSLSHFPHPINHRWIERWLRLNSRAGRQ